METKWHKGPWYVGSEIDVDGYSGLVIEAGERLDLDGGPRETIIGGAINKVDADLFAAAPALFDRILGRLDRCLCHPTIFDPAKDEGRGAGTCADCEGDMEVLKRARGES